MDRYLLEKDCYYIQELESRIYGETLAVTDLCFLKEEDSEVFGRPDYDDTKWPRLYSKEEWSGRDSVLWIRGKVRIPKHLQGQVLDLRVEAGPKETMEGKAEAMLYIDGEETAAFDNWHSRVRLPENLSGRGEFVIALRVWSGMNEADQMRHFAGIWLEQVQTDIEAYYYLAKTVLETVQELEPEDYRRIALMQMLDESLNCIDYLQEGSDAFEQSIRQARAYLKEHLAGAGLDVGEKPIVAVCGHTHIDMAWLWRLCHTRDKGARSFATVLYLMEQYPQYKFSQSSPLLYEMVKDKYPRLFNRIREKVREGRWEVTGGMWVEPDTNIPSGESLVRQLLLGKQYFRKEFGKETAVLWLPDVFGYSWVLPQLLKKSGIRLFWTNKMSWNQYNRIPYDTFRWRGMDGSEILTQLGTCPEKNVTWGSTYNGVIAPFEIKGTWDRYQQKDINREVLMPFGWGDGGGGPTREMLETYEVIGNMPGLPAVKMKHIEEFAVDLEENLDGKEVPVWDGELYFEYHRGTYTSQAFIKRANRKAEILYHDIELFSAIRDIVLDKQDYPAAELKKNWKKICTNQFHDIIPGSGIAEIYEDAAKAYQEIQEEGGRLLDDALEELTLAVGPAQDGMVIFNSLPWQRQGRFLVKEPPADCILTDGVREIPVQYYEAEDCLYAEYLTDKIPACGYQAFFWKSGQRDDSRRTAEWNGIVETVYYRMQFNSFGQMTGIYDKEYKREVLRKGGLGNVLCVFEDKPHQFEAWNTEIYALQKYTPITQLKEVMVLEDGPLKTVVKFRYQFHHSIVEQTLTAYQHSREIRFDTWADWHEPHALLKTAFDVNVRSTQAVYDIQFGNLARNTHANTSWDYAQFEVCAHKWADLSEGNYGVTLINDCKYGYDIKDCTMRLTLIKTSSYPDPEADLGEHVFSYALLPHGGSWKEAGSDRRAYEFNYPVHVRSKKVTEQGNLSTEFSLVWTDSRHVVTETVKKAEEGDAWIIRAYECMQCRGEVTFYFGRKLREVVECNLMEEEADRIILEEKCFRCEMAPYEIKTFKVKFI